MGGMVPLLLGQSTDRRFAALVLTRKQKAIAGPSVSFQQGSPGFQVRILLTFAVAVISRAVVNCNNTLSYFVILPAKGLSTVIFFSIKNIS